MKLSLIAAVSDNGVIGLDNALPWRIPEDLRYFKRVTMGKPVIMGRKTFQSIGRPLPGRDNIVVSSQFEEGCRDGVTWVSTPQAAVATALRTGLPEAMIVGGEAIYRALLSRASNFYLTEVHARVAGDAFFPAYDRSEWREIERLDCEGGVPGDAGGQEPGQEQPPYSFVVLERVVGISR